MVVVGVELEGSRVQYKQSSVRMMPSSRLLPVLYPFLQPDCKTTTISFLLVRETSVSRHHGAQLMAPWNPHKLQHYRNEGHKGGPQLGPIVSRDTSLSDSNKSDRCYIFSLAFNVREDASSYNFQGHPVYSQF